jgi:hypothetical protein
MLSYYLGWSYDMFLTCAVGESGYEALKTAAEIFNHAFKARLRAGFRRAGQFPRRCCRSAPRRESTTGWAAR